MCIERGTALRWRGCSARAKATKQSEGSPLISHASQEYAQGTDALELSPQQADAIVRVVEAAPRVRRRYQYFMWSQSQLQTLLPHDVLVCGAYLRQRRDLVFELFHSVVLPDALLQCLTDAQGPLLTSLMTAWTQAGGQPVVLKPSRLTGPLLAEAAAVLKALGTDALVAHGVCRPQRPAEIESFFVLLSPNPQATACQLAHLDLMLPYLHWSWQRVVAAERELAAPTAVTRSGTKLLPTKDNKGVTDREKQILMWVREGKSNQQIAEVLGISPLTVKNHIQKILRKMGCSNRAQAVAEAIAMGLVPGANLR
jgi:transcriptional regulator EpsA